MRAQSLACLLFLLGALIPAARADVLSPFPRPKRIRVQESVPQMAAVPPPNAWRIQVEVGIAVSKPRLTLPREALSRVLEKQETKQHVVGGGLAFHHLLPAVALAGLGLLLLRGRSRAFIATGFLVLAVVSFGASHDRLGAAPPSVAPKVKLGDLLLEDVEIVVKPDQDAITLTLPPSLLKRLRPE